MNKTAYQTELNQVRFTPAGREALADALMRGAEAAPAPRRINWAKRGLAAGLAAVVLAGSALAVGAPLWNHFFGELDDGQQAIVEALSQDLPAAECNGVVMTPLEALGDEDFYYLLLEITPPEGMVLPNYSLGEEHYQTSVESGISVIAGVGDDENEGYYQFMNPEASTYISLLDKEGNEIRQGCDYHWEPRTDENSPLIAVIRLWGEGSLNFADGTDKFLHLPGLWVQSPDKGYTEIFTGDWCFNIGAYTGGIESRTLDTTGVTVEDENFGTTTLESMRLSPLGMRYRFSWAHDAEDEWLVCPGVEAAVVMEDGSEVSLENSMGSYQEDERWEELYGPLESPVDLSKAVCVRWGSVEIPLN